MKIIELTEEEHRLLWNIVNSVNIPARIAEIIVTLKQKIGKPDELNENISV